MIITSENPAESQAYVPACNFCDHREFVAHNGRDGECCGNCGSLRRHRVALAVYRHRGLLSEEKGKNLRVLHISPEYLLAKEIKAKVGLGYMAVDSNPSATNAMQCLKLSFPDAFAVFPDNYFDFIVHNHVLGKIPGSYRDILLQFARILKPWGYHIFSVQGPDLNRETREGGEFMASDAERAAAFGQSDTVRQFGRDLPEYLAGMPDGEFSWDHLSKKDRAAISVPPRSNSFLIWRKRRGKTLGD